MNSYALLVHQEYQLALFFNALTQIAHDMTSGHYDKHLDEIYEKQKLVSGYELRKKYLVNKMRENHLVKRNCESLAMLKASYYNTFVLARCIDLFLTVKILLNSVSIKLQNGLVINVLKETLTKSLFQSRQLHEALRSFLLMYLSNRRIVSTHVPSLHLPWTNLLTYVM